MAGIHRNLMKGDHYKENQPFAEDFEKGYSGVVRQKDDAPEETVIVSIKKSKPPYQPSFERNLLLHSPRYTRYSSLYILGRNGSPENSTPEERYSKN